MGNQNRPTPIEVHVRSVGKKKDLFQKVLKSGEYYLVPLTGEMKVTLYNRGSLDGRKQGILVHEETDDFSRFHQYKWLLGIPKQEISSFVTAQQIFQGKIAVSKTYLLQTNEISVIEERWCPWCEKCGEDGTYFCSGIPRQEFVLGGRNSGGTLGRWTYG